MTFVLAVVEVTRQHEWLCAGGPATRQHKGPFNWLEVADGYLARQQKLVLAAGTNRFWPSDFMTM
jgi:hypothetical protein